MTRITSAVLGIVFSLSVSGIAAEKSIVPAPVVPVMPTPVFRPSVINAAESPVAVETKAEVVADDGLYRRVEITITFTNPNSRVFDGELELPLPDGATVCGYALEIDGVMEPGVICEKEKARLAFDNEKRKGVDPGLVEHVKGNLWKTRIYPLMPRTPRKAMVAYLEPLDGQELTVVERDSKGGEIFVGKRGGEVKCVSIADRLRQAKRAAILWDASLSRLGKTAADRARLELLPENGEWTLVVFRDVAEEKRVFTSRAELLKAIDAVPYDGGTSLTAAKINFGEGQPVFVFTDETDTLSLKAPDLEALGFIFASRPDAAPRKIEVRKALIGEDFGNVQEGQLLAVAWAANRIAELASQADARKAEFLELGRKYGVASPVTSLIVLENLNQYLEHKIEPPATSRFHEEWVKRRAAEDDPIAAKRAKTDHENALLRYWEERVTWWNNPIPEKKTPKSGVFAAVRNALRRERGDTGAVVEWAVARAEEPDCEEELSAAEDRQYAQAPAAERAMSANAIKGGVKMKSAAAPSAQTPKATVKIAAWNPKMPYLKALSDAAHGYAYETYLKEREVYGSAPSFYLDCAGWFFKAGEPALGCRIISNLAELKLEDTGLWRTMGWRLREAGAYEVAINVFRHVLAMCPEEPQSGRDLALVLTEFGKENRRADLLNEAAELLKRTAFTPPGRQVGGWRGRRGNAMQTCVLALEELNGLMAWCAANPEASKGFVAPVIDAAYRRDLPLALRIVMSWDTDETDVDLHVLEPDGEEAFFRNRRTSKGGFVSEDVTTGYGPEEYLRKEADKGKYQIAANYFASHRQSLTGAATVTATVYTGWGTAAEKRQVLSFRLDKPHDKHPIGEITVE